MGSGCITFCPPAIFNHAGGKISTMALIPSSFPLRSLAAMIAASAYCVCAQAPSVPADSVKFGWKRQFNGMLNLSQAYYDNWAKGGTDALTYELNLSGAALYDQEKYQWETKAKAIYGRTKLGSLASRKSSDELDLESIYTYKLSVMVDPFASLTGQTQFMPGFKYADDATRTQISDSFDPTYFTETIGLGVTPFKNFKERLGGSMKQTISSKEFGFADDPKTDEVESFKQEYGVTSITEYEAELMQNIKATTRLEIFANFKGWDEIDGRWANQITAKVNTLISVNFEYELLYDKDLSESYQTREGLSVGVSFLKL
jgi:hypothetical protein